MKRLKLNGEHLMKSDVRRKDKELQKKKTGNNKEEANYKGAEGGEPGTEVDSYMNFSETMSQKNSKLV